MEQAPRGVLAAVAEAVPDPAEEDGHAEEALVALQRTRRPRRPG